MTASTVTVGLLTSLTGSASSSFSDLPKGAQARIDLQNAEGGVDGRKIVLDVVDDTSSTSGNLTAAQDLIESKKVFGVISEDSFTFASAKFLHSSGVPVVGGPFDGPEWGTQPYTNMFGEIGSPDPKYPAYTTWGTFLKQQGATNLAILAYGASPSAVGTAKAVAASARAAGIKVGYQNFSVPFGATDFTSEAIAMKAAGVNSVYAPVEESSVVAIVEAARQAGVNLKVPFFGVGYGQDTLSDAAAVQASQGVYFNSIFTPVELNTPATKAFTDALKKYVGFTGVPTFGIYHGWVGADLMIKGLEVAGKNPTRQSFIQGLRGVSDYTAGGLGAGPVNFSLSDFGTADNLAGGGNCTYVVKLEGSSFVPVDKTPYCGTKIPNSDQE